MVSKISASIVGTALLVARAAAETQCVLKSNPPAGAVCGTSGYLTNEDSYDTYTYEAKYLTPGGCAEYCAARPTCVSWYLGKSSYQFCEVHTDKVAAAGFYEDANSYYYGYDQACYTCGPKELACPEADGTQFTVGASVFNIHCSTDYYGGDLARVDADTFESCLTSCASTAGCIDVAYNGHNCYMKSSVTSARQDANVWGAILATAEQAAAQHLSCPKNDGATYTSKSGDQFAIHCGVDYYGGDLSSLRAETLEDCLEACDTTSGCVDVAYHGDSKYCYLKNVVTDARQDSSVWGAIKIQSPTRHRRRSDLPPTARLSPDIVNSTSERH